MYGHLWGKYIALVPKPKPQQRHDVSTCCWNTKMLKKDMAKLACTKCIVEPVWQENGSSGSCSEVNEAMSFHCWVADCQFILIPCLDQLIIIHYVSANLLDILVSSYVAIELNLVSWHAADHVSVKMHLDKCKKKQQKPLPFLSNCKNHLYM